MADWFKTADGNVIVYNPAIAPESREFRDETYEEVVGAREGYTDLDLRLDEINQELTERMINVKFPPIGLTAAKGDGITDDTAAIQAIIDYAATNGRGEVYCPKATYLLNSSLIMKSYIRLTGAGINVTYFQLAAGITGIKGISGLTRSYLGNFTIMGINPYSINSIGIEFNEDDGGWHNKIENINIFYCEKGISARDSWYYNYIEQVLVSHSKYALYCVYKTTGSSINNTFVNFYVDKPDNYGIYLSSVHKIVFINPNIDCTTFRTGLYADTGTELTIIGGNFEGSALLANQFIINITSSTVTFEGTRLAPASAVPTAYGFNFIGTNCSIVLLNCIVDKITNLIQIRSQVGSGLKIMNLSPQIDTFVNATGGGVPMYKSLTAYEHKQSIEIDLSAAAMDYPIYLSTKEAWLNSATIIYTEATSADAGVLVSIKNSAYTLASVTTEINKALFSTTIMTIAESQFGATLPLRVSFPGGKIGVGKCVIEISYYSE